MRSQKWPLSYFSFLLCNLDEFVCSNLWPLLQSLQRAIPSCTFFRFTLWVMAESFPCTCFPIDELCWASPLTPPSWLVLVVGKMTICCPSCPVTGQQSSLMAQLHCPLSVWPCVWVYLICEIDCILTFYSWVLKFVLICLCALGWCVLVCESQVLCEAFLWESHRERTLTLQDGPWCGVSCLAARLAEGQRFISHRPKHFSSASRE